MMWIVVVILMYDLKLDDFVLDWVLKFKCFYFGFLGSKKIYCVCFVCFEVQGYGGEVLVWINGFVGFVIGVKSLVEIVVFILV